MGITIDEVESGITLPDDNDGFQAEAPRGEPSPQSHDSEQTMKETLRRIEYRRIRLMAD
nr:hypothetical protein [uncultured Desulfobacter sp.]